MIHIYIESGVEQAKGKNKKTTNEKDFIIKFIEHHFPGKLYEVDFDVRGIGGKDKLEASAPIFRLAENDTNIVVFDADSPLNGGGFNKRKSEIETQRQKLSLNFELFLWPNNHEDGDFETLLLKMINPKHQGVLDCFQGFEKCVGGRDPKGLMYELPGLKAEMYTYIEIMKLSDDERKTLKNGFYQFDNPEYWNLDSAEAKPLKIFFEQYFQ